MISSVRFAILDLLLGIILPNKRHLDYVSNDCDSAPFEELCNLHGVLLHLDVKGLRGEEDGLPSFVAFLSTQNQSVFKDRLDAERTTPVIHILFQL